MFVTVCPHETMNTSNNTVEIEVSLFIIYFRVFRMSSLIVMAAATPTLRDSLLVPFHAADGISRRSVVSLDTLSLMPRPSLPKTTKPFGSSDLL